MTPGDTLDPHSGAAHDIATMFWAMAAVATVVFLGTAGWIALSFLRRRRAGLPLVGESETAGRSLVLLFGIAIPIGFLIAVFTVGNFVVADRTDGAQARRPDAVRIAVTGRQWWWEVGYPGTPHAVTANEIHIPVRTPVDVTVRSDDVIHSFWVPKLNRKIDMIPGVVNHVRLYADEAGRYQGQCAEYCGVQHARMRLAVVAEPRADYDAWRRRTATPSVAPASPAARRGEAVFLGNACAACHQIRGTRARGHVGPDLTHLMTRATLAALTIPNTRAALDEWVRDPQHVKPGNRMPDLGLTNREYEELLAYLRGLR